ncbi:hypothetical protein BY996DRAFT_6459950 [Phakopsora pachyrhizi]|nr:hypothetical protein BY996DRAFT_6459950 [Phakopsora pachyrhizi]
MVEAGQGWAKAGSVWACWKAKAGLRQGRVRLGAKAGCAKFRIGGAVAELRQGQAGAGKAGSAVWLRQGAHKEGKGAKRESANDEKGRKGKWARASNVTNTAQKKIFQFALLKLQQQHDIMTHGNQEPCSGKFWRFKGFRKSHVFKSMEEPFKLSDVNHQLHLIVPSALEKKTEDLNTEELAEQEFKKFGSFFKQLPAFRRRELIGDFYKMCNGYYRLEPAGVISVVPNPTGRLAMQFPGATKTSTQRDMSRCETKSKEGPLPSVPILNSVTSKSYNLRTRSQNTPNPILNSPFHTRGNSSTRSSSFDGSFSNNRSYHPSSRSSSSFLDELRSERVQKNKDSTFKPLQEQKELYQSLYLRDALIASPSYQTRGKKEEDQDQKSKFGVERTSVRSLYQSPIVKASLSEYAASCSKEDISRLEVLRKEHENASKFKEEAAEKLKVLRSLKKEVEDDLYDLVNRKTSMSRRTSVVGSPLPTTVKISPKGSSIKPRTEHEKLMRHIPQLRQRLIEKIDNPPKDRDYCGYACVAWSSGKARGISTPELIRKHLSAELKKDKKMYYIIGGRDIDEDIRNTQVGKSAGVAGWLKMLLFGYAIANHLRRPLYYCSLDSMHTYLPTNSSYSGYPPFCMAFVDTNHYVVLHFKNVNGSIPVPPIC